MKRLIVLLSAFLFVFRLSYAQIDVNVLGSVPLGISKNYYGKGHPHVGFGASLGYFYPFENIKGLGTYSSFSALYNSSDLDKYWYTGEFSNERGGSYLNMLLTTGLGYQIPLSDKMRLFFNGQLGVNFSTISDITFLPEFGGPVDTRFDMPIPFTYEFGVHLLFNDYLKLGLNFFSSGEPEYKFLITDDYKRVMLESTLKRNLQMLMLKAGIYINR